MSFEAFAGGSAFPGCAAVPVDPATATATCSYVPYATAQTVEATYSGGTDAAGDSLGASTSPPTAVPAIAEAPVPSDVAATGTVVSASAATATVGAYFEFAITSIGVDGSPSCTVSSTSSLPAGITASATGGVLQLSGTPLPGSEGAYPIDATASCVGFPDESVTFELTVSASASLPITGAWSTGTLQLPTELVPAVVSYASLVRSWAALGNLVLGDCVEAAVLHLEQLFYAEQGVTWAPTIADAIALYQQASGGQSGPDVGTSVEAALYYWDQTGLGGTYVENFAALANPASPNELTEAVQLTGGLLATVDLSDGQGTGLHELVVDGVDATGVEIVTWGGQTTIPWSDWETPGFLLEVDALLPETWDAIGHGPSGAPASLVDSAFPSQLLFYSSGS